MAKSDSILKFYITQYLHKYVDRNQLQQLSTNIYLTNNGQIKFEVTNNHLVMKTYSYSGIKKENLIDGLNLRSPAGYTRLHALIILNA